MQHSPTRSYPQSSLLLFIGPLGSFAISDFDGQYPPSFTGSFTSTFFSMTLCSIFFAAFTTNDPRSKLTKTSKESDSNLITFLVFCRQSRRRHRVEGKRRRPLRVEDWYNQYCGCIRYAFFLALLAFGIVIFYFFLSVLSIARLSVYLPAAFTLLPSPPSGDRPSRPSICTHPHPY